MPLGKNKIQVMSILTIEDVKKLDRIAKSKRCSRSRVIRGVLIEYLKDKK
jgi:metal-responsive CopG/Arc/MetJ family transcriptional regulator